MDLTEQRGMEPVVCSAGRSELERWVGLVLKIKNCPSEHLSNARRVVLLQKQKAGGGQVMLGRARIFGACREETRLENGGEGRAGSRVG